ncbi:MAG: hypothetical protein FWC43_06490 [Planctomycetaceae bacterium]|nr:hypothetical protein [Planctomycetaceae bacterium]
MEKLNEQLETLINRLSRSRRFREELEQLHSIFPFSRYEYVISTLLAKKKLTFDEYSQMREDYINRNLFLYVYEISAPRGFGDTWALGHLMELEPALKRPSRIIDASYRGEYDLYLDRTNQKSTQKNTQIIKIEVKASRATDRDRNDDPLYLKALSSDSQRPFLMNFQQMKPSCCDVFLWIAAYRDAVRYWVINSKVIQRHKDFTPQHRNRETSGRESGYCKEDIYEGQIMMTEKNVKDFDKYLSTGKELKKAIIRQFKNQRT